MYLPVRCNNRALQIIHKYTFSETSNIYKNNTLQRFHRGFFIPWKINQVKINQLYALPQFQLLMHYRIMFPTWFSGAEQKLFRILACLVFQVDQVPPGFAVHRFLHPCIGLFHRHRVTFFHLQLSDSGIYSSLPHSIFV